MGDYADDAIDEGMHSGWRPLPRGVYRWPEERRRIGDKPEDFEDLTEEEKTHETD